MAKLKSGYKMVYEKDPITTTADHRDIRATKTIPAITDGQVELRDYETGTVIARNTFYKMYERIVDNAIRLYGVKRSDESVVEFTVHSSAGDLLMGRQKDVPPGPSLPIYKHTIVMSGTSEESIPTGENLTIVLYSTTDETLTAGPVDKQEVITKVLNNIISYENLSYPSIDPDNMNLPTGFVISSKATTGIAFICTLESDVTPEGFAITNIISDTVVEVTNTQVADSNEDFGYIHELAITDSMAVMEGGYVEGTLKLVVRLDTEDAVPAFGENEGTKFDTMLFLAEHLINVLYYKYDRTDESTSEVETVYNSPGLFLSGDTEWILIVSPHMWGSFVEQNLVEALEDVTE